MDGRRSTQTGVVVTTPIIRLLVFHALAGALLVTAFQPFAWWPLAFACLAFLFYQWQNLSPGQCFWTGLAFGSGLFLSGVSWVYVSLHTYGGMPLWMGSIAVLGFSTVLALVIALPGYLAARLFPPGSWLRVASFPLLWVVFEWVRSWLLTGFPWLELGYSQTPGWLFALAPIGGVYLVSLMVATVACILVGLLQLNRYRLHLSASLALLLAFAWGAQKISWSENTGGAIQAGIVQANVAIEEKWLAGRRDTIIDQLAELSRALNAEHQLDLLVWPETALPIYQQQTNADFWQSIVPEGVALVTGLLDSPTPSETYNAASVLCGGRQLIYRKRHLVPFGEYLPLRFIFNWVLEYLQLPMSDLSAWPGKQVLDCGDSLNIGLSICYEDAFASELRDHAGDASLLVNISEDGWFGDSFAPHQRLQMAQMRARELSRPMLRSANTGPSAIIDHHGRVVASTQQFQVDTLVQQVRPQTGETLYKRFGNWVVWLALLLLSGMSVLNRFRHL